VAPRRLTTDHDRVHSTADPPAHRFTGRDGLELAYRVIGDGRPLILLHGFTATGLQWLHHGPATALAKHGRRVILPDLRGHGESAQPHDPAHYPADVLADDGLALIDHLGLDDYDLGGYSLGGRIVLRMLTRGARPTHAVVAGQGIDAVNRATDRTSRSHRVLTALAHNDTIEPSSPEASLAHWIIQSGADPVALSHVLDSLVATANTTLRQISTPTLVMVGDQDNEHASAAELATTLPSTQFVQVPGNHFTAIATPELAAAITAFLDRPIEGQLS
jgi:pimeloyl-ACP methyl ester carboxylesterase